MSLIIVMNKEYSNTDGLDNIVAYALDVDKKELHKNTSNVNWECFGVNPLTPQTVIDSMNMIKRIYDKPDGKQLHHFVLSIYKNNHQSIKSKKNWCTELLYGIGNYLREQGFQNCGFIHVKYDGNVHIHFAVNSVNGFTGMKLKNEKYFYNNLLYYLRENYQILKWEGIRYDKY